MIATHKHPAIARNAMVVAAHPLAASAGIAMLGRGGNAVDAAVATMLALSVVEPFMSSIFGAGFMLIRLPNGETIALDNYAVAPGAARADMYDPLPPAGGLYNTVGSTNDIGHLAVGVPGSLAAYAMAVQRYGRLAWADVLAPAIELAAVGYPASPYFADAVRTEADALARYPDSARIFLPGGRLVEVGAIIRRQEYAQTLRQLAADGPDALYRGDLGRTVVADMARSGGLITMEDLAAYRVLERTPIRGTYRGYEIVAMPPASSGGIALVQMLSVLEAFDLREAGFGSARSVHLLAEALKIAFADRRAFLGDPAAAGNPPTWLTDKCYAALRRSEINANRAGAPSPGRPDALEGNCTTHVSAADAQGYVVSTTQTLNHLFGSRVTVPGTGMLLNNCMRLFDPQPGLPNSVEPGKRMLSSMTPTMVFKDGRPFLAVGAPGGTRIIAAVLQVIVNVIDHAMSLQEAVEAPRIHTGTENEGLLMEPGFAAETLSALSGIGHSVQPVPVVGAGMQAVLFRDDVLEGSSCWRSDGVALGLSGGPASLETGKSLTY